MSVLIHAYRFELSSQTKSAAGGKQTRSSLQGHGKLPWVMGIEEVKKENSLSRAEQNRLTKTHYLLDYPRGQGA